MRGSWNQAAKGAAKAIGAYPSQARTLGHAESVTCTARMLMRCLACSLGIFELSRGSARS
jgi:hypothetical protein